MEKGNRGFTKHFAKVCIDGNSAKKFANGDLIDVELTNIFKVQEKGIYLFFQVLMA